MAHFPVTNSNLSPYHLGLFIQEHYFPSQKVSCEILKTGISDTYLAVTEDCKYIFRVYSLGWRTESEIAEELRLLFHLRDHHIHVSFPIADQNERLIHSFQAPEGSRFGVLFSYAEGEKLLNYAPETHYRIGTMLAEMHLAAQNFTLNRVTYTEKELLIDPLEKLKRFLSDETDEMQYLKSVQQYLLEELGNADQSQLRKGAVHLDLWFDNLNITNEGKITFFDFDFCGNGWLCLDMAYYILQIHGTERDPEECQLKVDRFLEGYESVVSISAEEKRLIPMLGVTLYIFYLGIQSERYDNWSNVFLNQVYLKRFINLLLKKYFDHHKLGHGQIQ